MRRTRKFHYIAMLVCIFSLGVISGAKKWWPATIYQEAYLAVEAEIEREKILSEIPERDDTVKKKKRYGNLRKHQPEKAYNGYTFICENDLSPILIDMKGKVRHRWRIKYFSIWNRPKHIKRTVPQRAIACVSGYLYPNGSILAVMHGNGDTPYGYGLVKLDKDSKVVWKYSRHIHHDVYVADNEDIYTLDHRFIKTPIKGMKDLHYPALIDFLVILGKDGKEKQRISVMQAFKDTPHYKLLKKRTKKIEALDSKSVSYDITHTNSIQPLSKKMASAFKMFKEGDILISMRAINAIAVIDPETQKVKWAATGRWHGQHDARYLPDGTIMLFDNRGIVKETGPRKSRVLKIDPKTRKTVWEYSGHDTVRFFTKNKGGAELLPNGNILINTTDNKKLMEVTPDKKVVWQINTALSIPTVRRVSRDYFTKEFCNDIKC